MTPSADSLQKIPSAFHTPEGVPRFHMMIPQAYLKDAGVGYLARHETEFGGYEYATRAFLDAHLNSDTTFIDVGAHWGVFALHALTSPQGVKQVFAIEADPKNVNALQQQLKTNGAEDRVTVISSAAGAEAGEAPLVINSTMGNSLHGYGLPEKAPKNQTVMVSVAPLDDLLADVLNDDGPLVLKIDVEGFEPEVWQGMQGLIQTGRVQALIWEKGGAFEHPDRQAAMNQMIMEMESAGFQQWRFAHPELGGPLLPFAHVPESLNVFAVSQKMRIKPGYGDPKRKLKNGRVPPLSPSCRAAPAGPKRALVTQTMIKAGTTDASRWGDVAELSAGADVRADLIAEVMPNDVRVVDIGAGMQRVRSKVGKRGQYVPVDLLRLTPDTVLCDLNSGRFPRGFWDYCVLSHVLEYMHDPAAVLRFAVERTHRLIILLEIMTDHPAESGHFWSPDMRKLADMCVDVGWHVRSEVMTSQGLRIEAERLSLI